MVSAYPSTLSPTTKKVHLELFFSSTSRILFVVRGKGPSSYVRAISLPSYVWGFLVVLSGFVVSVGFEEVESELLFFVLLSFLGLVSLAVLSFSDKVLFDDCDLSLSGVDSLFVDRAVTDKMKTSITTVTEIALTIKALLFFILLFQYRGVQKTFEMFWLKADIFSFL